MSESHSMDEKMEAHGDFDKIWVPLVLSGGALVLLMNSDGTPQGEMGWKIVCSEN